MKRNLDSATSATEVDVLIESAIRHLTQHGFKPESIQTKKYYWKQFARFAGVEAFSSNLATRFLVHEGIGELASRASLTSRQQKTATAIRILSEIALDGRFRFRAPGIETVLLTPAFEEIFADYMEFCRGKLGHRIKTLDLRHRFVRRFLAFAPAHGANKVELFDARLISSFVAAHAQCKPRTVAALCGSLRSLIRFLCMQGLAPSGLRQHVPIVRILRDAQIPLGWRPEEIAAILGAVDRSSPIGKRDYAILLLATRLGMRPGDIRRLRLDNIHWKEARIALTQEKTGAALDLPLADDVGAALIEYLKHGRPTTSHREIFLRTNAPFTPFAATTALDAILTTYRCRAAVAAPSTRRGGIHGLRHALASRLLEVGTSIETISHVMGHVTPETTMIYAKVGIEDLRGVALSPEVDHE